MYAFSDSKNSSFSSGTFNDIDSQLKRSCSVDNGSTLGTVRHYRQQIALEKSLEGLAALRHEVNYLRAYNTLNIKCNTMIVILSTDPTKSNRNTNDSLVIQEHLFMKKKLNVFNAIISQHTVQRSTVEITLRNNLTELLYK